MKPAWDRCTLPLLGAVSLAALPQLSRAPVWLIAFAALFVALVALARAKRVPPPGRTIRWLLVFAGIAGIKLSFGAVIGREPGMSLFVLMAYLKVLEIRTERDRMVSLCMAYFLLAANLFFHQSVIMGLHMLLSVWATTAVMVRIHSGRPRWRAHLRESAALVGKAVPVMVVLFFLFPRLQGALWGVPGGSAGTTGFTSTLSLGDVPSIVKSGAVAFRAAFDQAPPPPSDRYWRGIVFWEFDGVSWARGRSLPLRGEMPVRQAPVSYTVTLEPTDARWMFALDMPGAPAQDSWMGADLTLRAHAPVDRRTSYRVTSYLRYQTPAAPTWEVGRGLQLPEGNPRTVALGRRWAADLSTDVEIVSAAAGFFGSGGFVYTLHPPPLSADPVDRFLFDTRSGYCEHFAAAFALLMRAAGVPSRVVGGYLGGEANPYGNYLIVRQSDAHAWVEILLDHRGWVRFDPTALVAPGRVEGSLAAAVPPAELPAYLAVEGYGWVGKGLKTLRLSWDAVNLNWHRWVAAYSYGRQASLLSKVGISMSTWRGAALSGLAAMGIVALLAAAVALAPRLRRRPAKDPAAAAYAAFSAKLVRAGLPGRPPHEGPLDYARTLSRLRPDLAGDIGAVTAVYVACRYGKDPTPADLEQLRRRVRRFKPPPPPDLRRNDPGENRRR